MGSAKHCLDQSAECLRLMRLAQSEAEAEVLKNLSMSWSRLSGQIDRYNELIREQGRRREVKLPQLAASFGDTCSQPGARALLARPVKKAAAGGLGPATA